MKKRLFGHFGFVYSEIFSHASPSRMQNVSKLYHVYAKLQQFFLCYIHDDMKNYLYFILFLQEHYILNGKCDTI